MTRPPGVFTDSRSRSVKSVMRYTGITATATALAVAAFGLSGCGSTVSGTATPAAGTVAAPATTTAAPSSTKAPLPLQVLVADTAARAAYFWQSEGAVGTDVEAVPAARGPLTCGDTVAPTAGAIFCATAGPSYDLIKYHTDALQSERAAGGDLAPIITTAHEVGHAAQDATGRRDAFPSPAAKELSADCAAGAYLRRVNADPAAVDRALPATALGKDTPSIGLRASDRREAFDAGFTGAVAPMACLDYRG